MKVVKSLNKESTIAVEGTVRERASKNPKLPTGDIEVVPTKIEVLGRCRYNSLPFEINRSRDADEALRLKYRYLDLRRPDLQRNILVRSRVATMVRQFLADEGFLEIETPILCKSTPEGARDYLKIMSYVGTAHKQGYNAYEAIKNAITGHPDFIFEYSWF